MAGKGKSKQSGATGFKNLTAARKKFAAATKFCRKIGKPGNIPSKTDYMNCMDVKLGKRR